jgi:hypothetical protein
MRRARSRALVDHHAQHVCSQIKLICVTVSFCRWRTSRRVGAIEFEFAGRDEKKFRALKLRAETTGLDPPRLSKKLLTEGDAFGRSFNPPNLRAL